MQKIKEIKNLNEIIFTWHIFSHFVFLPISIFWGEIYYRGLFIINTFILFIISLIKNKKLFTKQDLILLITVLAIFIIDFIFRRNNYTLQTYILFFRYCYIPCYFLNRTSNIKNILKYFSFFSKIIIIMYIFDPFFYYPFSKNYMGYGYATILPAFFALYVYFLIRKNPIDIFFLILAFLAIFIYGNRACLLAILFIFILTRKLLIRYVKKVIYCKKNNNKNKHKNIKKIGILLLLFIISFGVNYFVIIGIPNFINSKELSQSDAIDNSIISDSIEVIPPKKEMSFGSYSMLKYEEALNGSYNTILSGRSQIYKRAINVIKTTYTQDITRAIFGNGTGYHRSLYDGKYPHSIILDVMIEYGIIGLILMGGIFLYYFFKWLKNAKKDKFLFGAYLVCLAFPRLLLSYFFQKEMNLFLFIVFVARYFPMKKIKQEKKLLEK